VASGKHSMLDVRCSMLDVLPSPMSPRDRFLEKLRTSLDDGTFVKLTLSQPARTTEARNLYVRPVELRAGRSLSCVWRHATRDVTKNLPPAETVATIQKMLGDDFARAHLFTIGGDWQLRCAAAGDRLIASRAAFAQLPLPEHDRRKIKPAPRKFSGSTWCDEAGWATAARHGGQAAPD
jgi:hypothetical protein